MNRYNADSSVGSSTGDSWNYADEMSYPFGYGLSYTTFEQTLDSVERTDDLITATVTVTNTGTVAGKSVVELYAQKPMRSKTVWRPLPSSLRVSTRPKNWHLVNLKH